MAGSVGKFWESKTLAELSPDEWEALCDGCGRCCLVKLEDEDTGGVYYTDVACRLLDTVQCRCMRYSERTALVEDCVTLDPDNPDALQWMPSTCAYRIVHEGRPLPDWHPLVSEDPGTVHDAGISVRSRCIQETEVDTDDLTGRLIDWIETGS